MAFTVHCPACGTSLEVEDEHRGWNVRCPSCRHVFRAGESAPAATFEVVSEEREDEEEPRPKKRRRRQAWEAEDDDYDREDAAVDISGPATGLKAVGWIGIVFSILAFLIWVAILVWIENDKQALQNMRANGDDPYTQAAIYIPQSIIAFIVSILIIVGATKMGRLENRGWAMAACIMSMVPCISPCCLLGLPIGIWAINVMNRPHVAAAFRRSGRSRYYD
jgi:predicted Zn finger-like uncharacterized protein